MKKHLLVLGSLLAVSQLLVQTSAQAQGPGHGPGQGPGRPPINQPPAPPAPPAPPTENLRQGYYQLFDNINNRPLGGFIYDTGTGFYCTLDSNEGNPYGRIAALPRSERTLGACAAITAPLPQLHYGYWQPFDALTGTPNPGQFFFDNGKNQYCMLATPSNNTVFGEKNPYGRTFGPPTAEQYLGECGPGVGQGQNAGYYQVKMGAVTEVIYDYGNSSFCKVNTAVNAQFPTLAGLPANEAEVNCGQQRLQR